MDDRRSRGGGGRGRSPRYGRALLPRRDGVAEGPIGLPDRTTMARSPRNHTTVAREGGRSTLSARHRGAAVADSRHRDAVAIAAPSALGAQAHKACGMAFIVLHGWSRLRYR